MDGSWMGHGWVMDGLLGYWGMGYCRQGQVIMGYLDKFSRVESIPGLNFEIYRGECNTTIDESSYLFIYFPF